MDPKEKSRFDTLYQKNITALTRQGKADKTIDAYIRAVRRLADFVDRSPGNVSIDELKSFFSALIDTHSWSTVKLDLNGLRFFYKHVTIHSLRHSYATHLIEAGLNLRNLLQQLGHSGPQTTARYVRLTEKTQQNSIVLINQTLSILASALRRQQVTS